MRESFDDLTSSLKYGSKHESFSTLIAVLGYNVAGRKAALMADAARGRGLALTLLKGRYAMAGWVRLRIGSKYSCGYSDILRMRGRKVEK